MIGNTVSVLQAGRVVRVAEDTLCKGDVVLLQAGDLVPADLKLVEARALVIDEWELTGEILPAEKGADGEDVYIYRGSRVIRGNGQGIVVATGEGTEYAKILKQPWKQARPTLPTPVRTRYFILLSLVFPSLVVYLIRHGLSAPIILLSMLVSVLVVLLQNDDLFRYVFTSRQAKELARQHIHILDITSLRAILDVKLMCFDKTGVLTTRDLEVKRIHLSEKMAPSILLPDTEIATLIKTGCALCNDVMFAGTMDRVNPIDRALMSFASKNGVDLNETALRYKRIYDKPFDSEDRHMACGFRLNDKHLFFAKGDPEVILKMCGSYVAGSGIEKRIDWPFLLSLRAQMDSINQEGDMAIAMAFASGALEAPPAQYAFLCLIQLENPLNPTVPDVLHRLRETGIRTVMLTGDRAETAIRIGRVTGIETDFYGRLFLTGKDIVKMPLSEVAKQSAYVSIFARLLPSQKGILVRQLQQRNGSVAMIGDGANDTIALRAADVGISFAENGSPLAKRVSKILINDLEDLLTIIQSANRIESQVWLLWVIRTLILVSVLIGSYAWMLLSW